MFSPGESHGQWAWAATVLVGSQSGRMVGDEVEGLGKGLIVPCRNLDSKFSGKKQTQPHLCL